MEQRSTPHLTQTEQQTLDHQLSELLEHPYDEALEQYWIDIDPVWRLLEAGANVPVKKIAFLNSLGLHTIARLLILYGGQVMSDDLVHHILVYGNPDDILGGPLASEAASGWIYQLSQSLKHPQSPQDLSEALAYAAGQGRRYEAVELLLQHDADPRFALSIINSILHRYGLTSSTRERYTNIRNLLINTAAIPARKLRDLLNDAIKRGKKESEIIEYAQALIPRISDINIQFEIQMPLLHRAAQGGFDQIVSLLLQHGADVDLQTGAENETPLFMAVHGGFENVARTLLEAHANPNQASRMIGYTPLHEAVRMGHAHLVQLLLTHGARVTTKDIYGNTPYSDALSKGNLHILGLLKKGLEEQQKRYVAFWRKSLFKD